MKSFWLFAAGLVVVSHAAGARPLELTVEGRVGPYVPDTSVTEGSNALDVGHGANAFACSFGYGVRPLVMGSPQLSVYNGFGTVLVGAEAGFYNVRGRQLTNPGDCSSNNGLTTNELTVLPIMLTLTYRFDWALDHVDRFHIPLVPYVRAGLGGAGYLVTQEGAFVRSATYARVDAQGNAVKDSSGNPIVDRRDPLGFSLGGKLALGMMVALDFLEPLRALRARAKDVYKHTYFFVEVAAFDAGWLENLVVTQTKFTNSYVGPTLIVGAERLPMLSAGLAIAF